MIQKPAKNIKNRGQFHLILLEFFKAIVKVASHKRLLFNINHYAIR